jgi:hypothetical protein
MVYSNSGSIFAYQRGEVSKFEFPKEAIILFVKTIKKASSGLFTLFEKIYQMSHIASTLKTKV